VQFEGDRHFPNLLENIACICKNLSVPVIIKEVGCGIDIATARELLNAGVSCIDVGGKGGTSWAYIESRRSQNANEQTIGESFRDWGIPTAYSLSALAFEFNKELNSKKLSLIATGGLRDGVTIAKALALARTFAALVLAFSRRH
jgi:isopentenyl-diphosphate delta-isomerase